KARALFAELAARGLGPKLAAAAAAHVAAVDRLFSVPPTEAAIDAYLGEGRGALARGEALLAVEFLDEAQQVEALAPRHHRQAERRVGKGCGARWGGCGCKKVMG